jgi:hypothetical protein
VYQLTIFPRKEGVQQETGKSTRAILRRPVTWHVRCLMARPTDRRTELTDKIERLTEIVLALLSRRGWRM